METIIVTSENIDYFHAYSGTNKLLNIGDVLEVVRGKIPYPQINGTFAIVTDWQPSKNTINVINRKRDLEAKKYGWDRSAEIMEGIVSKKNKKDWVFFNHWSIMQSKIKKGITS
jgi:hypothetical protein